MQERRDKVAHHDGAYERRNDRADEPQVVSEPYDLAGHLADERGLDFLSEVKRGIGHWYAEHHAGDGEVLGPDAAVEIIIRPK